VCARGAYRPLAGGGPASSPVERQLWQPSRFIAATLLRLRRSWPSVSASTTRLPPDTTTLSLLLPFRSTDPGPSKPVSAVTRGAVAASFRTYAFRSLRAAKALAVTCSMRSSVMHGTSAATWSFFPLTASQARSSTHVEGTRRWRASWTTPSVIRTFSTPNAWTRNDAYHSLEWCPDARGYALTSNFKV